MTPTTAYVRGGHGLSDVLPVLAARAASPAARAEVAAAFVAGVNALLAERPELADLRGAGVRFVVGVGESA